MSRNEIEAATKRFLARGGKITKVPEGVSGEVDNAELRTIPFNYFIPASPQAQCAGRH